MNKKWKKLKPRLKNKWRPYLKKRKTYLKFEKLRKREQRSKKFWNQCFKNSFERISGKEKST